MVRVFFPVAVATALSVVDPGKGENKGEEGGYVADQKAEYINNDQEFGGFNICKNLAGDGEKLSGLNGDVKACSAIDCFIWCTWITEDDNGEKDNKNQEMCQYDECDQYRQDKKVAAGVCHQITKEQCNQEADMKKGEDTEEEEQTDMKKGIDFFSDAEKISF